MQNKQFSQRRAAAFASAKRLIQISYESEQHTLIHAINAFIETTRSANLAYERLSEWFGIYFPDIKLTNPESLAKLAILTCGDDADEQAIQHIVNDEQKAASIKRAMQETIGRKITQQEKQVVTTFANMLLNVSSAASDIDAYITGASKRIMPNVVYLTDEKIAAELLSKAGSIERLATMPASTIQLLGAEKALFKHIKFGSKPPKYGILFKLPEITNAPKEKRGKIARAYAAKIVIAARADCYTKHFIADKLKQQLAHSMEKIKASRSKPKQPQAGQRRNAHFR